MQRHLLGIIASILLLTGGLGLMMGFSKNSQTGMTAGVGLRAGLVLGALWMAYPQLIQLVKQFPKWMLSATAIVVALLVFGAKGLVIIVPVVIILGGLQFVSWIFQPLSKPRRARRNANSANSPPTKENKA